MICAKTMRASLLLRQYRSWDVEVLHDEGRYLGVNPPGQSDEYPEMPLAASRTFKRSASKVGRTLEIIGSSKALNIDSLTSSNVSRYRPNTAFIIMAISSEFADVVDKVKDVFANFGILALRADDIEHDGKITDRILQEIETAEFLFADVTGERPNVYYEIGYAHAIKRRVILYRKKGTQLHFDIANYNCLEYENLRHLKDQLTRRLIEVTNRQPRHE